MSNGERLIRTLLERGDEVAIELGRLVIYSNIDKAIPPWWKDKEHDLRRAVVNALRIEAFEYISFSVGQYGKNGLSGVTLQFESLLTGDDAYSIFNAEVTRKKNGKTGKKGDRLPKKSFRVGKRSSFYKFWRLTGLDMPRRLSEFAGYMGNLGPIIFTAAVENKRIDVSSLKPLSVPSQSVCEAILMGNPWANYGQSLGTPWAGIMGKDFHQTRISSGLQPNPTTGGANHGNTVISKCGDTGVVTPLPQHKNPQNQSVDEWLEDYKNGGNYRRSGGDE